MEGRQILEDPNLGSMNENPRKIKLIRLKSNWGWAGSNQTHKGILS